MADGPSSPEFNIETSPLASPAEIQRAKKGVEQFQSVLGQVDRKTRKEIASGRGSEMLQSMLLGIKPMCLPVYEEKTAFEVPQLSPFIKRAGDIFYDPQQVEQTISNYPEVFDDFDPGNGIDAYLKKVVETKKPPQHLKLGLLLGFPESAVRNYDTYQEKYYLPFVQDVVIGPFGMGWAGIIVNNPKMTFFTDLEKQIFMSFLIQDTKGNPLSPEQYRKFKEEHATQIADFLHKQTEMPQEAINYASNVRSVSVKGFGYGSAMQTEEEKQFPQRVNYIYQASGMNSLLTRQTLLGRLHLKRT